MRFFHWRFRCSQVRVRLRRCRCSPTRRARSLANYCRWSGGQFATLKTVIDLSVRCCDNSADADPLRTADKVHACADWVPRWWVGVAVSRYQGKEAPCTDCGAESLARQDGWSRLEFFKPQKSAVADGQAFAVSRNASPARASDAGRSQIIRSIELTSWRSLTIFLLSRVTKSDRSKQSSQSVANY